METRYEETLVEDLQLDDSPVSASAREEQLVVTGIHDAFAGLFTAILMQLQAVTDLPADDPVTRKDCLLRAQELARTGLRQVRTLVETNHTSANRVDDFLVAMRALVLSLASDSTTESTLLVKGNNRPLKDAVSLTLQRILEEAIKNIERHAHATTVKVQICFEEDRIVLEVTDNGDGFSPNNSLEVGFGLVSMRTRVDRLGGGIWINSSPGQGTNLRVDLHNPYSYDKQEDAAHSRM